MHWRCHACCCDPLHGEGHSLCSLELTKDVKSTWERLASDTGRDKGRHGELQNTV